MFLMTGFVFKTRCTQKASRKLKLNYYNVMERPYDLRFLDHFSFKCVKVSKTRKADKFLLPCHINL